VNGSDFERRVHLTLGREVFGLCLQTLTVGTGLAEEAGLEERFVSNKERFERVCKLLDNTSIEMGARLALARSTVQAIRQYTHVSETGLPISLVVGAGVRAAKALLRVDPDVPSEWKAVLQKLVATPKSEDEFERFQALSEVDQVLQDRRITFERREPSRTAIELLEAAWIICWWHYFRLERRRTKSTRRRFLHLILCRRHARLRHSVSTISLSTSEGRSGARAARKRDQSAAGRVDHL
jgi:hypothetical protein